ncbi:MAG: bifunctional riboflavin kinase/FAD synthetase [Desulfobacteraceae bacterium]|jgi:riboflavin kinase/FMN adenylyltransferase|nr:MAG: bifunctional riboflavin kinase/FAD synthetase [Desulfobacteraceae bacterium]
MKIINDIYELEEPFKKAVVTIGNFDGVHKGHQAILHQVIEKAEAIGGTSVAVTFEPHPIRVLKKNGQPPLITLFEQKTELISQTGIDVLICIRFDETFAAITARQFVEDILVRRIGTRAIIIGEDYAFGRNREGNVEFLREYGKTFGFEVIVAQWISDTFHAGERISSTRVREVVTAGNVEEAWHLLGRYYQVRGRVVSGRNRGGKLLGFPTANIHLTDELCPKTGVYAVTVTCKGNKYKGVANIGYSPTFDDNIFTVEVHILDFNDDIYDEPIRVNFIRRIRDEAKFENIEALIRQITKDIEAGREILANQ